MDLNRQPPEPARLATPAPPGSVKVHIDTLSIDHSDGHDPATLRHAIAQSLQQSLARELPSLIRQPESSHHRSLSGGTVGPDPTGAKIAAAINHALNP